MGFSFLQFLEYNGQPSSADWTEKRNDYLKYLPRLLLRNEHACAHCGVYKITT